MEFGLMTEPQVGGTYQELVDVARWAEEAGLDVFARADHWLMPGTEPHATDALASLAGLARDTRRIELCVLVSPITFRHPAVIAKTAATIDEMSGGRFRLGIGTGWMEAEHQAFGLELWPMKERYERLFEALRYVRAAFGRDQPGFHGRHYSLEQIEVLPAPTGDLPIIVGGSGAERTPTLAGRFADEYNTFVMPVEDLEARVSVMRDAAREADRDPDVITVSAMGPVIGGSSEAEYREQLAGAAAARDLDPDELAAGLDERGRLHGTYEQVAQRLGRLEAAGLDRYYLQVFDALGAIDTAHLDEVFSALRG